MKELRYLFSGSPYKTYHPKTYHHKTYLFKTYQRQNLSSQNLSNCKTYQTIKLIKTKLINYKTYPTTERIKLQNLSIKFMNLNFQIIEMFQQFFKNPRILRENSVKSQFPSPFLGRHGYKRE